MHVSNLFSRRELSRKLLLGALVAGLAIPLVTAAVAAEEGEVAPNFAPGQKATVDYDYDGLTDVEERQWGLDPYNSDSDFDGLGDGDEFYDRFGFTDPLRYDTDYDGLGDGDEVFYYGTDPYLRDTDFDGRSDLTEVLNGTDPRNPFN